MGNCSISASCDGSCTCLFDKKSSHFVKGGKDKVVRDSGGKGAVANEQQANDELGHDFFAEGKGRLAEELDDSEFAGPTKGPFIAANRPVSGWHDGDGGESSDLILTCLSLCFTFL